MKVATGGGSAETLLTEGFYPRRLTVDGTDVFLTVVDDYATSVGRVIKVPKGGGTAVTLASGQVCPSAVAADATDLRGPSSIALDDGHVYWTNVGPGTVEKAAKDGASRATLARDQQFPVAIVVDATDVYWIASGGILRAPK